MLNKLIVSKGFIVTISMVLAKSNWLMLYNDLWDPWEQVDPCTSLIPAELPLVGTIPSSESIIINFLMKLLLTSAKTSLCYYRNLIIKNLIKVYYSQVPYNRGGGGLE